MADNTIEQLIDHMIGLLGRRFSRDVSNVYFGDIGVYLPSAFVGPRKESQAIIAIQPSYNHLMEGERVAAYESRLIGLDIITMVNITQFFEAMPSEAYGERILVRLVTEIATFLTQEENVNLGGRVQHSEVKDIDWAWIARGDQAIRAAGIAYECRVRIPRM